MQTVMATFSSFVRVVREHTPSIVSTLGVSETRRVTRRIAKTWMLQQQVMNVLHHLQKTHGIPKKEVTKDVLPKRTPPNFQAGNTCLVLGLFHLVYVSSVIVPCESAKGVYKSSLYTEASFHR